MYNVAPYVERCLRSLEEQDIPQEDYEIICINDGSPDNCSEVVRRLQAIYPNILLIEQENQGVSNARNNGINAARGKYVIFIDPDDYISPNSLCKKIEEIEKHNLDVAYTGYIILDEHMRECYRYDLALNDEKILSGVTFFNKYEKGNNQIRDPDRSWAIFFKYQYLIDNNLRFLEDVPYLEDGEFMARAICLAERVTFINDPFYIRTTRKGSATHSGLFFTEKARKGFLKAANNLVWFKDTIATRAEQKAFLNYQIIHFVILYIITFKRLDYFSKYKRIYKDLKTSKLKYLDTNGCTRFYSKMGRNYNFSLHWFFIYLQIHLVFKKIRYNIQRFRKVIVISKSSYLIYCIYLLVHGKPLISG